MLYIGRVHLKYTEKEFWSLTPRKFYSQIKEHNRTDSSSTEEGFIDQIKGW